MIYQKNKYRSIRCRCAQEHMHDSKGEAGYCNSLQSLVDSGDIAGYKTQVSFDLHGRDGKKIATHRVDFLPEFFDGHLEVHEYKGFQTDIWTLKKALFEHEYHDIPYVVIYHKESKRRNWTSREVKTYLKKGGK